MENRSPKVPMSKGKCQSSCVWGLVDMFDFRNGRTNQKLISNGRTMHRHGFDAKRDRKGNMLANFYQSCQGLEDGAVLGNNDADACKNKLKDIVQEEFPTGKRIKKLLKAMKQQNRSDFGSVHQLENDHKKKSKTSRKSSQLPIDHRKEKIHLEDHQCSDELSLDSHKFAAMLEEICSQIHRDGSITPSGCKQLDEINVQLLQMSAKAFIDQIYINRRYISKDAARSKSKPFSDASEILPWNRDLFLKLLQDRNSKLVRCIQRLQFLPREKERIKLFLNSKSSESHSRGTRSDDNPEITTRIQKKDVKNLLLKKPRHQYGSLSKGNTNVVANEIVVMKPASKIKNPENVSCFCSSSLQSQKSFKNKGQNIRSTYFSLKEIKRKFKQAVRESPKQQNLISLDGSLSKLSRDKHSLKYVDKGVSHGISTAESIVCYDAMRQENQQKPVSSLSCNGSEIDCNNEVGYKKLNSLSTSCSKQRQIDIFIEAKMHLSERFRNVNVTEEPPRKQSPRTLQMILSSPDHDLLVTHSPNRDMSASVSAEMRFSLDNNVQKGKGVTCTSPQKQNEEVPPSADIRFDDQLEVFEIRPNIPDNINAETQVHKNICAIGDDLKSGGHAYILEENESTLPENLNILEVPYEPNMADSTCCGPSVEATEFSEDNDCGNCSSSAGSLEDHHQRALLGPSSSPSDISALENMDTCKYKEGHPSPVSVLEPLSPADANSPTSIIRMPDESPLEPRRIDFDDHSQVETPEYPRINITANMDEDDYMSAYVRAVMQASYMNFEDLSATLPSLPHVLNTYAIDRIGLFQVESQCDLNLLFDCIHEVLVGVYHRYFGYSSRLSFLKPNIRPAPREANVVNEVVKKVNCYISPKMGQPTLDELAEKDIAKSGSWLELFPDTEDIVIQIAADVLQESLMDTVLELQI